MYVHSTEHRQLTFKKASNVITNVMPIYTIYTVKT